MVRGGSVRPRDEVAGLPVCKDMSQCTFEKEMTSSRPLSFRAIRVRCAGK